MTAVPPSSVGAVNETDTSCAAGAGAVTPVGCPGAVVGTVMDDDASSGSESPASLVASAEHVYECPLDRFETVMGDALPDALR